MSSGYHVVVGGWCDHMWGKPTTRVHPRQHKMLLPKRWSSLQTGKSNYNRGFSPIVVRHSSGPSVHGTISSSMGREVASVMSRSKTTGGRIGRRTCVRANALFGLFKSDPAEATRKKYQARVDQINALEPGISALSDDQLRAKTAEFKARVAGGETLNNLLPEAFAVSSSSSVPCTHEGSGK